MELLEPFHLHPLFVHFPIALFISAMGLETAGFLLKKESLQRAAFYNYLLAIPFSLLAVGTGWMEAEHHHLVNHPVLNVHRLLGLSATALAVTSAIVLVILKKRQNRWFEILFLVSLILIATEIAVGGYYGGRMVYEYGIGVEGG